MLQTTRRLVPVEVRTNTPIRDTKHSLPRQFAGSGKCMLLIATETASTLTWGWSFCRPGYPGTYPRPGNGTRDAPISNEPRSSVPAARLGQGHTRGVYVHTVQVWYPVSVEPNDLDIAR